MGKVSTYCQISGCSPEVEDLFDWEYSYNLTENELKNFSGLERREYEKVRKAFTLLVTEDEREGIQRLSIIGPYDRNNRPIWGFEENPDDLNQLLREADGHVREIPDCHMGSMFYYSYCDGPTGDNGAIVSYGGYFFVQTTMLAILAGATQDRVPVQRLWKLAMAKGHYENRSGYGISGVDYGPIRDYQWGDTMWLFGDADRKEVLGMGSLGTPQEIAEALRKKGFWMWMRPDRFPIEPVATPRSQPTITITEEYLAESRSRGKFSKLPPEIIQKIMLELDISGITALATINKLLYYIVFGNQDARDSLAKAHIHKHARWCLPYGEAELKWWHERQGDDTLGWDYLRRCYNESHSMRNRRRIWKAAETIGAECEKEGQVCRA